MDEYDMKCFFDKGQESEIGLEKPIDELISLITPDNTDEIIL